MARKVTTTLIDDVDGTTIDDKTGTTLRFALEGTSYEIDLSNDNADKLRAVLAPFVAVARVSDDTPASTSRRAVDTTQRKVALGAIRQWARSNGYKVSDRGRVSRDIVSAFDAVQ